MCFQDRHLRAGDILKGYVALSFSTVQTLVFEAFTYLHTTHLSSYPFKAIYKDDEIQGGTRRPPRVIRTCSPLYIYVSTQHENGGMGGGEAKAARFPPACLVGCLIHK